MTEENTRILKLFYAIIGSSGFVKAGELAGLLQTFLRMDWMKLENWLK